MYPAKHFQTCTEENHKLGSLINDNPLATLLINIDEAFPHISHIPFHFCEHEPAPSVDISKVLIAHVSNHHPLAKKLLTQQQVPLTLVFHGEQSYISPHCHDNTNANSKDNTGGQVVPTWNYAKVHITGIATPLLSPEEKLQQMKISSHHFEREQEKPWDLTQLSDKKTQQMLSAITFFTVTINNIEGHFKLSQNKPEQVKKRIAEQLFEKGKDKLATQIQ